MQVQIKFITTGACEALGEFSPGDTARVSPALAAFLVDNMKAAKVMQPAGAPVADKSLKRTRKARA